MYFCSALSFKLMHFAQSLSNHHLEMMRAKEYTLGTCRIWRGLNP